MLEVMDQAARHLVNSRTGPSWFSESLRGHADRPISGFSHSTGTFAELRDHSAFDLPADAPPTTFWCYGTMGIGLSRVPASRWLPGSLAGAEVEAALTVTRAHDSARRPPA
ncbi:hypothetical protein AB0392_58240 [Nonomuraea angiospora]|uniref:hypothetical protein n=1 Tax=Nonomuraea angiospora TaxID=46172 RepID=UPI00344D5D6B